MYQLLKNSKSELSCRTVLHVIVVVVENTCTEVIFLFFRMVATFVNSLYKMYVDLYFTYLEINPLVVTDTTIYILDLAAKLDATADFVCRTKWGNVYYPPPFGRDAFPEEAYIADLDSKSGASLKVNSQGRSYVNELQVDE